MMGALSILASSALAGVLVSGCGGDSSDPEANTASATTNQGVGNTSTSNTSSSTSGAGGNAATTDTSTVETSTTGSDGGCTMTVPPNATISEFGEWNPDGPNWSWGEAGNLTGGTFGPYSGSGTTDFSFTPNMTDGALEISGTVNDYAGFGMWFGPCTSAAAYAGIQFDIAGTVGDEGSMNLQFQTFENQSVDDRGGCAANCGNAQTTVEGITADMTTLMIPFDSFTGGSPSEGVSTDQLLALQFQFECATDGMCAVDVTLDNLQFY
jgi:hypothetical protein